MALSFYSKKYDFIGKIDEAIETENEIILIERKYTNEAIIGPTIRTQIGLLAILLEENIKKPVNHSILIFSKNNRKIVHLDIDNEMKYFALSKLVKHDRLS